MINHYIFSSYFTFATTLLLGLFVLLKSFRGGKLYFLFSLYTLCIALWSFCVARLTPDFTGSYAVLGKIIHLTGALLALFFVHFVFVFIGQEKKFKALIVVLYLFAVLVQGVNFFAPNFIVGLARRDFYSFLVPGSLYPLFSAFFSLCVICGLGLLLFALKNSTGQKRNEIFYLLIGTILGYIGGLKNFFVLYDIKPFFIYPYGTYLVPVYVGIVFYAIIKHHLLDIRLAVTRAGIFIVVYAVTLGLPFVLGFKTGQWVWATALSSILVLAAPFVYDFSRRQAEYLLFFRFRHYQEMLKNLAKSIVKVKGIDEILQTAFTTVNAAVEPEFLGLYVFSKEKNLYELTLALPVQNKYLPAALPMSSTIVQSLWDTKAVLLRQSLDYNIGLPGEVIVVPCFVKGALFGFGVCGPRQRLGDYVQDDLGISEFLSSQIALALENSLLEEEKAALAREEQIRRNRSIDAFSASLAHEINNPAFAIMGLSDSLQVKVTQDLKDRFNEKELKYFNDRLGQLHADAIRITKLVKAVREFSGRNSGEFTLVALESAVDEFLQIVGSQLKEEGVNFSKDITVGLSVHSNKIYLEEILMNFTVNAIHALRGTDKEFKEINLKIRKNTPKTVLIEFMDNGSGIEPAMLENIFLDFVTTKPSTESLGMGLSRVRKIVNLHKGRVWAQSAGLNQGATFFVEFPEE